MARSTLEARVAALEERVTRMAADLLSTSGPKDWRQAIGLFPNNELMKQIDAAGQALREADRRRACRPRTARGRAKP